MAVAQEEITFARRAHDRVLAAARTSRSSVDVTFATDQPGIDEKELGRHQFGSGPVLTRGSTLDPRGVRAAARDRPRPRASRSPSRRRARSTGTDADAIHISRAGIPTGVVSVPLRYMHSPVEMVQLDDVENAARLIAAFARRLEAGR